MNTSLNSPPVNTEGENLKLKAPGMLEVHIEQASELDDALAEALDVVQVAATAHRTGILVTRIGVDRYIVRAHPAVPFGLVRQRHDDSSD